MYRIYTKDCPKGFAYVMDFMGNKVFYGKIKECKECIEFLSNIKWEVVRNEMPETEIKRY